MLTGATGVVGRAIHLDLLRRGHEVRVTARPDIFACDASWWAEQCQGADAIIHSAWYVEHGRYANAPENAACVHGSFALAQGAAMAGVRHVIGLGTCMEYRLPGKRLSVDAPLEPANFYAACKLAAFYMMGEWLALHNVRFSWCRLFYLFGEGEHPDRLSAYIHRQLAAGKRVALSSGMQMRDFLDISIAGPMIASLVDSGQQGAINICSGVPITLRAFAEQIADLYGRRDLLDFGGRPSDPSDPAAVVGVCNLETSAPILEHL